ncbi:MAG: hypothetical protein J5950_01165 [Clostridia bacterium]|nr:hypothetical protein [Clostridia bacterium]
MKCINCENDFREDASPCFNIRQTVEKSYTGPAMTLIIITLFAIAATSLTAIVYDIAELAGGSFRLEVIMQLVRNALHCAFSLVSAIASVKALALPAAKNINAFYAQRPFMTVRRVLLITMMIIGTVWMASFAVILLVVGTGASARGLYKDAHWIGVNVGTWQYVLLVIGIYVVAITAWIISFIMIAGTYGRITKYYHMITAAYTDNKHDTRVKPPFIRCFVIGSLLIVLGLAGLSFCFSQTVRYYAMNIFNGIDFSVADNVLRSLLFQLIALMLMGVHLILNGVIIHKYEVRLNDGVLAATRLN